ncbi:MAG TPA: GNAT family N-acetyltransferase [Myxococcaceae bacterium]|nr:GNAT family N-acetyltransferase [Myxococcaceae bacterium]
MKLRTLDWDSDFFGVRIARLEETRLDPEDVAVLEQEVAARGIDCVYLLADEALPPARALTAGFWPVDERVTLELEPVPELVLRGGGARPAVAADARALEDIAGEAHRGTRFFTDPHFPKERSIELYRTWIRNSLGGAADAVLVVDDASGPAGYATASVKAGGLGEIGLVGVAARARGQGLGRALVAAVVHWIGERGCTRAQVVTQGLNAVALRLYQGAGFRIARTQTWYHRWTRDAASR